MTLFLYSFILLLVIVHCISSIYLSKYCHLTPLAERNLILFTVEGFDRFRSSKRKRISVGENKTLSFRHYQVDVSATCFTFSKTNWLLQLFSLWDTDQQQKTKKVISWLISENPSDRKHEMVNKSRIAIKNSSFLFSLFKSQVFFSFDNDRREKTKEHIFLHPNKNFVFHQNIKKQSKKNIECPHTHTYLMQLCK